MKKFLSGSTLGEWGRIGAGKKKENKKVKQEDLHSHFKITNDRSSLCK